MAWLSGFDGTSGITDNHGVCWHISDNYCPHADHRTAADGDVVTNTCAEANEGPVSYMDATTDHSSRSHMGAEAHMYVVLDDGTAINGRVCCDLGTSMDHRLWTDKRADSDTGSW